MYRRKGTVSRFKGAGALVRAVFYRTRQPIGAPIKLKRLINDAMKIDRAGARTNNPADPADRAAYKVRVLNGLHELEDSGEVRKSGRGYYQVTVGLKPVTVPVELWARASARERQRLASVARSNGIRDPLGAGPRSGFIQTLERISLQTAHTDQLIEEILRREHLDLSMEIHSTVNEQLSREGLHLPNWKRDLRRRLRPIDTEVLERMLTGRKGRVRVRRLGSGDPGGRRGERGP